jgi:CubicO group peptidase (beta-lactamase class C family)
MKQWLLFTALLAAGCEAPPPDEAADAKRLGEVPYAPSVTPSNLGIAGYAKVLCSAVFVSGRKLEDARNVSGYFFVPEEDFQHVTGISLDQDRKAVRVTLRDSVTREARYFGDQGCVIIPEGEEGVFFQPTAVTTTLPDPATQDWPMGDVLPSTLPDGVDKEKLDAAVALAFKDPKSLTAAFVVLYKGQIVAERYGEDAHRDMQLESWSMGKSITATLIGLLIQEGSLALDQPAPVPAWQADGDPRKAIAVRDLLNMSSGLHFTAPRDPDYSEDKGYPDHMFIYTGAIDAFEFSYGKSLQFPPGTEGRYRNSDPLTLGYLVKKIVTDRGEDYLTYPQRALFDRIGIRRQVLETDPYGNFLLTGYDYGTARNWARLGLLYLRDGLWLGERLLPEGFVEFVSTPAPAWKEPVYGGLFWLNGTGVYALPREAYYMAGAGGQRTFVVPSHDLVIVRMGHFRGDGAEMSRSLNEALRGILEAVEPVASSSESVPRGPAPAARTVRRFAPLSRQNQRDAARAPCETGVSAP